MQSISELQFTRFCPWRGKFLSTCQRPSIYSMLPAPHPPTYHVSFLHIRDQTFSPGRLFFPSITRTTLSTLPSWIDTDSSHLHAIFKLSPSRPRRTSSSPTYDVPLLQQRHDPMGGSCILLATLGSTTISASINGYVQSILLFIPSGSHVLKPLFFPVYSRLESANFGNGRRNISTFSWRSRQSCSSLCLARMEIKCASSSPWLF